MDFGIASHQARSYTVATPVFEGPLDLLLHLIERAELDITRLALSLVADQYLEHIRAMQELAVEEVSAFLVIAARLLQIKSEALLPRPPLREEGEEDPGEALARQLILYKKYKAAAQTLVRRETDGLRTYIRLAAAPKIEGVFDMSGLTLQDLVEAALSVFNLGPPLQPLATVVAPPRITIRERIQLVIRSLRNLPRTAFHQLLSGRLGRVEIVVTFLAVLELIKRNFVDVEQTELFGVININATGKLDENEDFDLEFGE